MVALVAVVKMGVALRTPQELLWISWGPQVEKILLHHAHTLYQLLDICIHPGEEVVSPQAMCHWTQVAGCVYEACCLLESRHLREAPSFQTGKAKLMKDVTLEGDQVGPRRSDFVTSGWGGVVIIWTPRLSRGNPFGWLITLERVRRSEEDMADKVH